MRQHSVLIILFPKEQDSSHRSYSKHSSFFFVLAVRRNKSFPTLCGFVLSRCIVRNTWLDEQRAGAGAGGSFWTGFLLNQQLDPVLVALDAEMSMAASEEDAAGLKKQIKSREDALLPMYLQVIDTVEKTTEK